MHSGSILYHLANGMGVAQPAADPHRVGHMGCGVILRIDGCRHAALGHGRAALLRGRLGQHQDMTILGRFDRRSQPPYSAADNENVRNQMGQPPIVIVA